MPNKIIKNRPELETSELRRKALDIVEAGIERVLPGEVMQSALSFDSKLRILSINEDKYALPGRLFVIGAGKASGLMAEMVESIIGTQLITDGLIIDKADPKEFATSKIRVAQAGHPIPDQKGVDATLEILALKQQFNIGLGDVVICLISGGGSALMTSPLEGVTLEGKQSVTNLLLSCGASIHEINCVRKHLSRTKGGGLARHFAPAKVISLILSDVIGNDLAVIASGPTCSDDSTFPQALGVLAKYHLIDKVPEGIVSVLERGCCGEIGETQKSLGNAHNYIIGDVGLALTAMEGKARTLGFNPLIISSNQMGDTASVAAQRAHEIQDGKYSGFNALLLGGETTPTLPDGHGRGGRNQHYAVCSLRELRGYPGNWVLASVGTDGSDFIPEVAGAIVDNESLQLLEGKQLDLNRSIQKYDSFELLSGAGNSLIITGNTHTNVGDVILYLLDN